MTSNGIGILLIIVERIKIDIAPTWEGLLRTTGRIGKRDLERTTVRIKNERSTGTIHREELENE